MDLVITTFKWNKSDKDNKSDKIWHHLCVKSKKKLYKWIIYKTETDSQT